MLLMGCHRLMSMIDANNNTIARNVIYLAAGQLPAMATMCWGSSPASGRYRESDVQLLHWSNNSKD
jgi:hypothetical protein